MTGPIHRSTQAPGALSSRLPAALTELTRNASRCGFVVETVIARSKFLSCTRCVIKSRSYAAGE